MLNQITALVVMNIRSIPERLWMSLATVLAIAVVVAVLLAFLAMGNGFRETVNASGADDIAMIMRTGSQSELNSTINKEQVNLIANAPGIVQTENGGAISPELYVIVDGKKRSTLQKANLPFRGLNASGINLRKNVTLVEGRIFEPGKNELLIGEAVAREYEGFDLGKVVKLGRTEWEVVGIFSARGSVFDSELWTDARTLQSQFQRGNFFQIVRAQLEVPGEVSSLEEYFSGEPRLTVEVKTEKAYYQTQSKGLSDVIFYIGWPLAITMALGALAGALNTMYNSVAQRTGEIATLRAIGFTGFPVFVGTLAESLVLAAIGGLLGTTAAYLFFDGMSTSTLGSSFTQIVFTFDISVQAFKQGIMLAIGLGFVGGFFPALRAARLPVILAFAASN